MYFHIIVYLIRCSISLQNYTPIITKHHIQNESIPIFSAFYVTLRQFSPRERGLIVREEKWQLDKLALTL